MDMLEFVKKFTAFKPSPYQEAFIKLIEGEVEKGEDVQLIHSNYNRWYKNLGLNEFACSRLMNMTKGQTFALVSPGGVRVFKMVEFREGIG